MILHGQVFVFDRQGANKITKSTNRSIIIKFLEQKKKKIKYKNFSGANFHFLQPIAWASFRNDTAWASI